MDVAGIQIHLEEEDIRNLLLGKTVMCELGSKYTAVLTCPNLSRLLIWEWFQTGEHSKEWKNR